MGESGRYLYAVTRGLDGDALRGVPGLREATLQVVEKHGLCAVVSDVDLDEFGEQGLREHLEDLRWLEQVARRHDDVVHAVAGRGPTAPLRLATICLDDDGVRSRLTEWHDALAQALDRVEGRSEWSVKVYVTASTEPGAGDTEPGSGADYLRRKRAQSVRRREAEEHGTATATELHAALAGSAVASRLLPPQDPRLTGHEGTMTLNGAYLVADVDADEFVAETGRLAAAHADVRLEVQGPWPPYSFATLDQP